MGSSLVSVLHALSLSSLSFSMLSLTLLAFLPNILGCWSTMCLTDFHTIFNNLAFPSLLLQEVKKFTPCPFGFLFYLSICGVCVCLHVWLCMCVYRGIWVLGGICYCIMFQTSLTCVNNDIQHLSPRMNHPKTHSMKFFCHLHYLKFIQRGRSYRSQMVDQAPWVLCASRTTVKPRETVKQPSVFGQVNMWIFQVFRQRQKRDDSI